VQLHAAPAVGAQGVELGGHVLGEAVEVVDHDHAGAQAPDGRLQAHEPLAPAAADPVVG
jgi:hypothetical protein